MAVRASNALKWINNGPSAAWPIHQYVDYRRHPVFAVPHDLDQGDNHLTVPFALPCWMALRKFSYDADHLVFLDRIFVGNCDGGGKARPPFGWMVPTFTGDFALTRMGISLCPTGSRTTKTMVRATPGGLVRVARRRAAIGLASAALLYWSSTAHAQKTTTAGELLRICRSDHAYCQAYVMGVVDGTIWTEIRLHAANRLCFRNDQSYLEIAEAYISYLTVAATNDNTAVLSDSNTATLEVFLLDRYHCQ